MSKAKERSLADESKALRTKSYVLMNKDGENVEKQLSEVQIK